MTALLANGIVQIRLKPSVGKAPTIVVEGSEVTTR